MFLNSFTGFSQEKSIFDLARFGTVSEIENLINANKNLINSIDEKGSSLLILSCYYGNYIMVEYLVKNKINIDYVSDNGTALMAAVVKGDKQITSLLLKNNANPNLTDANGTTALIYAIQLGKLDITKLLLQYNANKQIIDNNGKTAFEFAVISNNNELINLLK